MAPILEKFDPGMGGSAACHNYPLGPLTSTLGEKQEPVCPGALTTAFGQSGMSQEGKNPVGKTFISPSAPLHDMGRQPDILLTGDQFLGSACV